MQTSPAYTKNETDVLHFQQLKKLVYQRVAVVGKKRLIQVRAKAFLLPFMYAALYITALCNHTYTTVFYLLYAAMGCTIVLTFLNCVHEAAHNILFNNKKWNSHFMYVFDVMGANSFIWKTRHIRLHHNFANVKGWESDIQQNGLFKILPADKRKRIQKYQHFYIFLMYPLYLLNWLLVRDFKDFFNKKQVIHKVSAIPVKEYYKLFFFKLFFIFYTVVSPCIFFNIPLLTCVMSLIIMLVAAGIIALFVLLPPHANSGNDFPLTGTENSLPTSWFIHQMRTTNDVSNNNWFTKHCMGNFNYHLAHHLFPNISYAYAKEVTSVIKQYSSRHMLPYKTYPLLTALSMHYRLVKTNGLQDDFFEEDM